MKTTKETTAKAGFSLVLSSFGLSGSGSVNTQLINNNTNAFLFAKSSGGTKSISESWDFTNGPLKSVSTSDWSSSVDYKNSVVLKIKKAVPIYDLVADPTKKAQIKAAVEKYMADRQLELVTPLHRLWLASKIMITMTTEKNDLLYPDWAYDGLMGYLCSVQISGTTPLYRFWHAKKLRSTITTDRNDWRYPDWAYDGLVGYVYPAN